MLSAFVSPRTCTFAGCSVSGIAAVVMAIVFLGAGGLAALAMWKATVRRSAWGEASVIAAIGALCFLVVPLALDRVFRVAGAGAWAGAATFLCPAAAITAIVMGRMSGKRSARPSTGNFGYVLGIIETAVIVLFFVFVIAAWDLMTDE